MQIIKTVYEWTITTSSWKVEKHHNSKWVMNLTPICLRFFAPNYHLSDLLKFGHGILYHPI